MGYQSETDLVLLNSGAAVERDLLGVVAEITRRYPNLRVQYLDPSRAMGVSDAPYQIVERCKDGTDETVLQVWELDNRVLQQLEAINSHTHDLQAIVERSNKLAKEREEKLFHDSLQDAHEKAASVIKSNKDTYVLDDNGKRITIRSNGEYDVRRD